MSEKNGFGVTSLTLGIVGFFVIPLLLGTLAIIFGAIGLSKKQKYAKSGLILGIIDVIWGIVCIFLAVAFLSALFSGF